MKKILLILLLLMFIIAPQAVAQIPDPNNLDQEMLNELFQKKIHRYNLKNGNLGTKKQKIDDGLVDAAEYQTLYQFKRKKITHKCDIDKNDVYLDFKDGRIITGEICVVFYSPNNKKWGYKKLVNKIFKLYKKSPEHLEIIKIHSGDNGYFGMYTKITNNGTVYNTVEFAM